MELRLFSQAISGDFVALMSGVGSVVLLILGLTYFLNRPVPRGIVFIVAAACFFLSAARVWTTEYRAKVAAQQLAQQTQVKLDDLAKPDFRLQSFTLLAGDVPYGVDLFLNVGLRNLGAQSSAFGWKLTLRTETASIGPLHSHTIPDRDPVRGRMGQSLTFHKDNRIEEKTLSPIEHNAFIAGWLWFQIPNVDVAELRKSNCIVSSTTS